jgi:transposase
VEAQFSDLNSIPTDDPKVLKEMLLELMQRIAERDRKIDALVHQLEQLRRHAFGRRAEAVDPDQYRLILQELLSETDHREPELPVEPPKDDDFLGPTPGTGGTHPKGHGRRTLPAHLKRERKEYELSEAERQCPECGTLREKIGEEIKEQLEYVPASLVVIQHVRFKYACRCCQEHVATAPLPHEPIEKGMPASGLLAQVLVSKFQHHLPLNRQSTIFARHGIVLSRSTLGGWVEASAELLEPIWFEMKRQILFSHAIQSDDTTVPVLDRDRTQTKKGRLWAYLGDADYPYTIFDYTPDRRGVRPREFLEGFRGLLQVDAYGGYDALFKDGRIVEVACWAHARRRFFEAQTSDQLRSLMAMAFIKLIYKVEREAKGLDPPARQAMRDTKSRPWLEAFKNWLETERTEVLPRSPIGEAIGYAMDQWQALNRYLDDGRLEIDNNDCERALRTVAIGRKNWMFAGSDAGGKRAAIIYTLIESAKRHGVDPFAYLRDLLDRVSIHPASRIAELLPDRWSPSESNLP